MSVLRTAVIGYGLAGRVFHCPFVSAVPGLELSIIVQRRGDEAAAAYPQARILRSVDEVFSDPAIDLVVVATPNASHFDLARQALRAGKHVVIDKPFAASSIEARELLDLSAYVKRIVAPFHNRRYDGDFLTVRRLLAENTLGRVVSIHSRFDRFRPLQRPNSWKETGGGINGLLFDLGPHLIDQALALFGAPQFITGSVRNDRDQTDIDDGIDVTLEFEGEERTRLLYHCGASMLAAEPAPRFLVHGTHGSYQKFGVDPQEPTLVSGKAKPPMLGAAETWLTEPESAWGTLTLATERTEPVQLKRQPCPTLPGDYREFYAGVRDAIHGVRPLPIPSQDGYRVIRLLELARQSSEMRCTIPVLFE